tara:strand:+ start:11323 stop:11808 length:486 start_codon:yes stop_codon:yes gene_type:complete
MITKLSKLIVTLSIITVTVFAQFRNDIPTVRIKDAIIRNNSGNSLSSIFNSDRLFMDHSFSVGMVSMGGFGKSYGAYSNKLNYVINDNWSINSRIDLIQPTGTSLSQGINTLNPMLLYDAELKYKAGNNLNFSISMDNRPRYYNNWGLSPYNGYYSGMFRR